MLNSDFSINQIQEETADKTGVIRSSQNNNEQTSKSMTNKHQIKGSFWHYFIDNSRLTLVIIFAIVLVGILSTFAVDIEANPEVEQPIGIVQTFYPNSSPEDIESEITNVLEKAIIGQAEIKEVTSSSGNNLSLITVTYQNTADTKEVLDELRNIVAKTANALPADAENPEVLELNFNDVPVVTLSVTSSEKNLKEISDLAEDISDELKTVNGVSKIDLDGLQEESVKVILDSDLLNFYEISLNEVIGAISGSNINAPLGEISKDSNKINIRLIGKISNLDDLRNLPIRNADTDGSINLITLSQLAKEIDLIPDEQETISGVNSGEKTTDNTVTLQVYKQKGGNIVKIAEAIEAKTKVLQSELDADVQIIKTNDNAYFIKKDLSTLFSNGIQTVIIIFFSLLIFLSLGEALVASFALPFIMFITMAVVYFSNSTLNGLTVFSLIMSLGLIIDNIIVIVEGIHEFRKEGYSKVEAAKLTINTYKWPLVASTATTISAFLPMLLVGGIVGEFIKTIPLTLNVTLIASLFVSFAITPLIATTFLSKEKSNIQKWKDEKISIVSEWYGAVIRKVIYSSSIKSTILIVTAILFFLSLSLPFVGILKAQLFPKVDVPFTYINFTAPAGTTLAETREKAQIIEEHLATKNYVDNYVVTIGKKQSDQLNPGIRVVEPNTGNISLNFTDITKTDREKSYKITEQLRNEFEEISTEDLKIEIVEISSGPPTAAPIEVKIIGPELSDLEEISLQVKAQLENQDGLINIQTAFDNIPEEAKINFNPDYLAYYGVTNQQVAQIARTLTTGFTTGTVKLEKEEYDLDIFLNEPTTKDISELSELPILTPKGEVPLSYLGEITIEKAINNIPHIDEERSVRVRAFTEQGVLLADILPKVEAEVKSINAQYNDYTITIGGEDADIQESFRDLFNSMSIAIILILIILVMVFRSFRQTAIILSSIPLAIIGVFPGLALLGLPLSFPAFLGLVMLSGVVVNDAIVLIDQINNLRKNGMATKEAVIKGASSRLVPVLLTTITTILGLIQISLQDEFWRGLGFAVMFGLATATFLTLLIIPIGYSIAYRKEKA